MGKSSRASENTALADSWVPFENGSQAISGKDKKERLSVRFDLLFQSIVLFAAGNLRCSVPQKIM